MKRSIVLIWLLIFLVGCGNLLHPVKETLVADLVPSSTSPDPVLTQTHTSRSTQTASSSSTPSPTITPTSTLTPTETITPTITPTPLGGGSGEIYFIYCKEFRNKCGIYRVNTDGSNFSQYIIPDSPWITDFSFSPDRQSIAVRLDSQNKIDAEPYDIPLDRIILVDGSSKISTLAERGRWSSFLWSPDGNKIAFLQLDEEQPAKYRNELYVANANGSNKIKLSNNLGCHSFAWSSDSERIAFISDSDFDFPDPTTNNFPDGVYLVNHDGSNLIKFETEQEIYSGSVISWLSADERLLISTDIEADPNTGWLQNLLLDLELRESQSNLLRHLPILEVSNSREQVLLWRPNNRAIAQGFDGKEGKNIVWMGYGELGRSPYESPVWSPKDEYIALIFKTADGDPFAKSTLIVASTDGNYRNQLMEPRRVDSPYGWECDNWSWDWSPDGNYILYSTPFEPVIYLTRLDELMNPTNQKILELDSGYIGKVVWVPLVII